jgi:hypothetical protein
MANVILALFRAAFLKASGLVLLPWLRTLRLAPFAYLVVLIIGIGPTKQMCWFETSAIVAFVQYANPVS